MELKILLIDDDDLFAYLIKRHYSKIKVSITHASNYSESVSSLNESKPSLILLDMNLIGYEGLEFYLKLLKEFHELPKTLIISSSEPPDSIWEPYEKVGLRFIDKDKVNSLSYDEILKLCK